MKVCVSGAVSHPQSPISRLPHILTDSPTISDNHIRPRLRNRRTMFSLWEGLSVKQLETITEPLIKILKPPLHPPPLINLTVFKRTPKKEKIFFSFSMKAFFSHHNTLICEIK